MTTQSIVILAGIVLAFAVFGIALAWADCYTQGVRKPGIEAPAAGDRRHVPAAERRAA